MPQGSVGGSHGNGVAAAVESQSSTRASGANKNEVKISAEGIAKLSFNFLDELHGDSSLEPGEVKTPPNSPSPVTMLPEETPKVVTILRNEQPGSKKLTKSASQLDAQACQEKVRAILELDAKKRQLEKEKQGAAPGMGKDGEQRRLLKEERRRLKKMKKEKKAAMELNKAGDDDDDDDDCIIVTKKKKKRSKDYESDMEADSHSEEMRPSSGHAGSLYTIIPAGPPHPLPPPFPDNFMSYHAMNPFLRLPPPDFHMQRGVAFHLRGRGGIRGALRYPGFRPPFVHGLPRHHNPLLRPQNPLPSRGHSPILAPNDNLIWTTTKPSLSYAFNSRDVCTSTMLLARPLFDAPKEALFSASVGDDFAKSSPPSSERRKKSKKSREREKIKKRRSSRKSCERASKRKIEKIRKSLEKLERKHSSTSEEPDFTKLSKKLNLEKSSDDSEEMWDKDEHKLGGAKVKGAQPPPQPTKAPSAAASAAAAKSSITKALANEDHKAAAVDDRHSSEDGGALTPEGPALPPQIMTAQDGELFRATKNFDMFADSPPQQGTPPMSASPEVGKIPSVTRNVSNLKVESNAAEVIKKVRLESQLAKATKVLDGDASPKKKHSKASTEGAKSAKEARAKDENIKERKDHLHAAAESTGPKPFSSPNITQFNEMDKASEGVEEPSNTPPQNLLKPAAINLLKQSSHMEKSALQKAKEMQSRIDKLLKDDDLDASIISKIKAKSLEHKRRKEKEASTAKNPTTAATSNKKSTETECRLTPEMPRNTKNPFRRSTSRTRHMRSRSRSRTPKGHTSSKVFSSLSKNRHNTSFSASQNFRERCGPLNRSRSGETEKDGRRTWKVRSKSPREQRCNASAERVTRQVARRQDHKYGKNALAATKKAKQRTPLSFTAAEFLFPSGEDDSSSQKALFGEQESQSSEMPRTKGLRKSTVNRDNGDSPDTDDYMDNWENDVADLDINSSNACDSSTPLRSSSQEDADEQTFVSRFINPSPPPPPPPAPLALQQSLKVPTESKTTENNIEILENVAIAERRRTLTPPLNFLTGKSELEKSALRKDLFGMQEIYDQFIRSVEESGVDLKASETQAEAGGPFDIDKNTDNMSKSSSPTASTASSTSTSSSSSSNSSSSETSNSSTSSSSSSSSSASSSEESNDADENFANVTLDSPRPKPKVKAQTNETSSAFMETQDKELTPPLPTNSCTPLITAVKIKEEHHVSVASTELFASPTASSATHSAVPQTTTPSPTISQPVKTENPAPVAVTTPPPALPAVKTQKSDVAKDFKKLKNLEANLARIQMMRANYDSADEISEELLKMEKLFLQEKNLILQKYAKSSTGGGNNIKPTQETTSSSLQPQMETSTDTADTSKEEAPAEAPAEANKIFDTNREAIKLTISPIKLPKTPAIFEKLSGADERESEEIKAETEEADFTEKLKKPVKEVAIVKPMMETKEARQTSQHRSRRSSPSSSSSSRQANDSRPRSPGTGGYHRERRRSTSRSRFSPQRRQRIRSLSISPPFRRSGGSGRCGSPLRRGLGGSNNATSRFRSTTRRSRSRTRSPARQSSRRRGGDLSPLHSNRSRRCAGSSGNHSFSNYRKSAQSSQRATVRDSCSRSRSPRSPLPRPHSPRSPPPGNRRRSYSRDRYSSRSPLPFKPPSPPMRRSLSPHMQRRSSLSPNSSKRSHSSRRSPRSPRSRSRSPPAYDDHRHRRAGSYDRRSPSLQHQYFLQDAAAAGGQTNTPPSSYYYDLSPNRISLDARINIVLNAPPNQESGVASVASYESYSTYSQYGGQYMSVPPHHDVANYSINYVGHQYVPMSVNSSAHGSSSSSSTSSSYKTAYSHIPTIGGGGGGGSEGMAPMHHGYYYNEFGYQTDDHHSVLKELPKATVAVQKGNVLEIVPTSEMSRACEAAAVSASSTGEQLSAKGAKSKKSTGLSWKEEVKNRHIAAAVMRLSRESEGTKGILRKSTGASNVPSLKEESSSKPSKKKVYFEDGIFPNRDSEDEDRKTIDIKIRRKIRRLRKLHGIVISAGNLVKEDETKVDPELESAPPPPPPPNAPPVHLEQPVYLRPPSPTPLLYFHYDAIVHSMYVSQLERPIPPRLLNPKALPPGGVVAVGTGQSPANTQSPNSTPPVTKKDLSTFAVINRSSRAGDRSSPKLTLTSTPAGHRRENPPTSKAMPIETISTENPHKNSFQSHPTNATATSPQAALIHTGLHPSSLPCVQPPPRAQCAPMGFMGMRINNFMRLPLSPLARAGAVAGAGIQPHTVPPPIGMRHTFNMPPPTMMPPNGHPAQQHHQHHMSPTNEFAPPPQQHHLHYAPQSTSRANSPHIQHHPPSYAVHQQPPSAHHSNPAHFAHTHHHPPPTAHALPNLHLHHQPSAMHYVQSIPPPPLPPSKIAVASMAAPGDGAMGSGGQMTTQSDGNMLPNSNTQAMIPPFNVKRQ